MGTVFKKTAVSFFIGATLLVSNIAQADIVLSGTRYVYNEADSEINIQVKNKGKKPSLIQSWVDTGNPGEAAEKINTPFILTPPVSRIDAGQGQTLRMVYTKQPLPTDHESVFWLSVLEVPAKVKTTASAETPQPQSQLQLAFRTRVKVFFRPKGLPGLPAEAPKQVKWKIDQNKLQVTNNSAYSISFNNFTLTNNNQSITVNGNLAEAKKITNFPIGKKIAGQGWKVKWSAINDFGGVMTGIADIQ
ncbi:fimbria/pilus periplasmic chaperone [Scandinavium sp. H11S7]|uniref:fimbria/pilus periplasmic chaperone n=1 Tax=Scandinavium hiltneri TaxID=2926519 RepID=UPI0021665FF2|nr:fimbria/pilus periplasmic chaperone [Scandinavium hiltneri]MCS2155957.1 fimbria/pilus periplasmic chaperone [Scandinavium hiltneri]